MCRLLNIMRFTSQPTNEHKDVPLADEGRLENILKLFNHKDNSVESEIETSEQGNRSYVVSLSKKGGKENKQAKLTEILGLVEAQGHQTVGYEVLSYGEITPKTFIGSGTLLDIAKNAREMNANLLVFDVQLSPSQMRNIEHTTGFSIGDRESVILDIFVRHANSRKAQVQVELAQLKYLKPRIRGIGLNMDQQAGGIMGSRGAGETASELLARQLDKRLTQLQKLSTKLSNISINQRKQRSRCKRIALIGYTNAGKTSLMNQLVGAELSVKDQVFETLDSTTRRMSRTTYGDVLLSDTVGFIRELPKHLLDSFESTLAEITETDLLVIVLDASHPEIEMQLQTTLDVLEKLGAEDIPRLIVFNKLDLLDYEPGEISFENLAGQHEYVAMSSQDNEAVIKLKQVLLDRVSDHIATWTLYFPYTSQKAIRKAYSSCEVLGNASDATGVALTLRGPKYVLRELMVEAEEVQL
ncbi:GTPase HflX [Alteromonadaceae bacterium M269]|nr:GTPase HflX [Alteromonadaceae bacterium M269]